MQYTNQKKEKFESAKGISEAVQRKRIDNAMDKRKGTDNDLQNTKQKTTN